MKLVIYHDIGLFLQCLHTFQLQKLITERLNDNTLLQTHCSKRDSLLDLLIQLGRV